MAQDTVFYQKIEQLFAQNSPPIVMGILNITTDSFFDGGKFNSEKEWLAQTEKMIVEGAEIIDIGAYSTRPNANNISEENELTQLVKAITSVRKHFPDVLISADTFRAKVAEQAVKAGANMINDISGGTIDNEMFATIAKLKVPYILMHIQGTPQTMQQNPQYRNVVKEVFDFFKDRLATLKKLGVNQVIIDPGFGFGKTLEHNYELMNHLEKFQELNTPLLIGISRKSMIYKLLKINQENALNGTTVLNTIAIQKGANILRVHDVREAKETIDIYQKLIR